MNELSKAGVTNISQTEGQTTTMAINFFDPVQFETLQRVCRMFASSELVPDMYKVSEKNPIEKAMSNCMIALELSGRIGASPLMIMQNMVPIYGKPSWSSKFLIGTVNSCGRFEPLKYRFTEKGMLGMVDFVDYEFQGGRKVPVKKQFDGRKIMDIECVAYTSAKGSKDILESSPISVRLSIQEGWYTKNGSKWPTMTQQMLMYRAASFWTSAYAPELSMGMRTVEEIQDVEYIDVTDVATDVSREIAQHAGTETIGMDDPTPAHEVVDTTTGEITPTPAPASTPAETPGALPGL